MAFLLRSQLPWCPLIWGAVYAAWGSYFATPGRDGFTKDNSRLERLFGHAYFINGLGLFIPLTIFFAIVIPAVIASNIVNQGIEMEAAWQATYAFQAELTQEMAIDAQRVWYRLLQGYFIVASIFIAWVVFAFGMTVAYTTISWRLVKSVHRELARVRGEEVSQGSETSTPDWRKHFAFTPTMRGSEPKDDRIDLQTYPSDTKKEGFHPNTASSKGLSNHTRQPFEANEMNPSASSAHLLARPAQAQLKNGMLSADDSDLANRSPSSFGKGEECMPNLNRSSSGAPSRWAPSEIKDDRQQGERRRWLPRIRLPNLILQPGSNQPTRQWQQPSKKQREQQHQKQLRGPNNKPDPPRDHSKRTKELRSAFVHIVIHFVAISPACALFLLIALMQLLSSHAALEQPRGLTGTYVERWFAIVVVSVVWVTCVFGSITLFAIALRTYEPVFSAGAETVTSVVGGSAAGARSPVGADENNVNGEDPLHRSSSLTSSPGRLKGLFKASRPRRAPRRAVDHTTSTFFETRSRPPRVQTDDLESQTQSADGAADDTFPSSNGSTVEHAPADMSSRVASLGRGGLLIEQTVHETVIEEDAPRQADPTGVPPPSRPANPATHAPSKSRILQSMREPSQSRSPWQRTPVAAAMHKEDEERNNLSGSDEERAYFSGGAGGRRRRRGSSGRPRSSSSRGTTAADTTQSQQLMGLPRTTQTQARPPLPASTSDVQARR